VPIEARYHRELTEGGGDNERGDAMGDISPEPGKPQKKVKETVGATSLARVHLGIEKEGGQKKQRKKTKRE